MEIVLLKPLITMSAKEIDILKQIQNSNKRHLGKKPIQKTPGDNLTPQSVTERWTAPFSSATLRVTDDLYSTTG